MSLPKSSSGLTRSARPVTLTETRWAAIEEAREELAREREASRVRVTVGVKLRTGRTQVTLRYGNHPDSKMPRLFDASRTDESTADHVAESGIHPSSD